MWWKVVEVRLGSLPEWHNWIVRSLLPGALQLGAEALEAGWSVDAGSSRSIRSTQLLPVISFFQYYLRLWLDARALPVMWCDTK